MKVPFVDLKAQYESIREAIDAAISGVILDTAFIGGKYVKQFEQDFAAIYGVKNVVSCANGTDSLYIIMKMLGIGPGDEVITAANSWISSSETITQAGAKPVFADVHPRYYSIDEARLEAAITHKTKAVIAVHLQGQICDLRTIKAICDKHNIYLVEDCAQAHFSEFEGLRAGLTGVAGSFSFYPGKNLGAYGDAGCIITNDDLLAERFRMYASHGALKKHQHQVEGINSRLDGMQAAILSAKLPHILKWTEARIACAAMYRARLSGIAEIVLPELRPGSRHTYHLYVIRAQRRDALKQFLEERGIETAIHYPTPLPLLPCYQYLKHTAEDFPVAAALQQEILSLPIFPELEENAVDHIAAAIKSFYQ